MQQSNKIYVTKIQLYGYISNIFVCRKRKTHGSKTFGSQNNGSILQWLSAEKNNIRETVAQDLGNNISVLNIIYSTVVLFFF